MLLSAIELFFSMILYNYSVDLPFPFVVILSFLLFAISSIFFLFSRRLNVLSYLHFSYFFCQKVLRRGLSVDKFITKLPLYLLWLGLFYYRIIERWGKVIWGAKGPGSAVAEH